MTATVIVATEATPRPLRLDQPGHRVWLTREFLTDNPGALLHRNKDQCLCLRQAAGRWQLHYARPSRVNLVRVISHDWRPITAANRRAVVDQLSHPSADVFGSGQRRVTEFDLSDGSWVVGIRATDGVWYFARLDVAGQPAEPHHRPQVPPGDSTTDDGKAGHLPTTTSDHAPRWPQPLPDALVRANAFLNDYNAHKESTPRRVIFAELYREYLDGSTQPGETPPKEVRRRLQLGDGTLDELRQKLRDRIWGKTDTDLAHLRRFLLDNRLLTAKDLDHANRYIAQLNARNQGRAVADEMRAYQAQQRKMRQQAAGPTGPPVHDAADHDDAGDAEGDAPLDGSPAR
jgi:hypothetical protein